MINDAGIYHLTTENRLMIAGILDTLDDAEWNSPTLCAGWTVGHIAAHFVQPMLIGFGRFLLTAVRYRGDTDKTVDHFTHTAASSRAWGMATRRAAAWPATAARSWRARVGDASGPLASLSHVHLSSAGRASRIARPGRPRRDGWGTACPGSTAQRPVAGGSRSPPVS